MACPICREEHDRDRGLSFDGVGINSCGMYRTRIASFMGDTGKAARPILGPMFAASPDMLAALESLVAHVTIDIGLPEREITIIKAREAIAKAKGEA